MTHKIFRTVISICIIIVALLLLKNINTTNEDVGDHYTSSINSDTIIRYKSGNHTYTSVYDKNTPFLNERSLIINNSYYEFDRNVFKKRTAPIELMDLLSAGYPFVQLEDAVIWKSDNKFKIFNLSTGILKEILIEYNDNRLNQWIVVDNAIYDISHNTYENFGYLYRIDLISGNTVRVNTGEYSSSGSLVANMDSEVFVRAYNKHFKDYYFQLIIKGDTLTKVYKYPKYNYQGILNEACIDDVVFSFGTDEKAFPIVKSKGDIREEIAWSNERDSFLFRKLSEFETVFKRAYFDNAIIHIPRVLKQGNDLDANYNYVYITDKKISDHIDSIKINDSRNHEVIDAVVEGKDLYVFLRVIDSGDIIVSLCDLSDKV